MKTFMSYAELVAMNFSDWSFVLFEREGTTRARISVARFDTQPGKEGCTFVIRPHTLEVHSPNDNTWRAAGELFGKFFEGPFLGKSLFSAERNADGTITLHIPYIGPCVLLPPAMPLYEFGYSEKV